MERLRNLDALAQALVEAARNLRTAKLHTERTRDAAREVDAAMAIINPIVAVPPPTTSSHVDQDVRRALAPIGVLAGELAENVGEISAIFQKLGEDLLRAGQAIGQ